jgi:serine/threonine-protein kinase
MPEREPREGTWIAGCRLESQLGRGGMGTVWRAWQERAERIVALKLIRPGLSDDPAIRERFRREAQLAIRLQHPNIVPVLDAGEDDGTLWILMHLVAGTDLRAVMERGGRLSGDRVARLVLQVAGALD